MTLTVEILIVETKLNIVWYIAYLTRSIKVNRRSISKKIRKLKNWEFYLFYSQNKVFHNFFN